MELTTAVGCITLVVLAVFVVATSIGIWLDIEPRLTRLEKNDDIDTDDIEQLQRKVFPEGIPYEDKQ